MKKRNLLLTAALATALGSIVLLAKFFGRKDSKPPDRINIRLDMDILAHPENHPIRADVQDSDQGLAHDEQKPLFNVTIYNETWTEIKHDLFIHSAYEDPRSKPNFTVIRIIAMMRQTNLPEFKFKCIVRHQETNTTSGYAVPTPLHEQHNSSFLDAFILCFIKGASSPMEISLIDTESGDTTHWLAVAKSNESMGESSINVCVKPIYGDGNNLQRLAEFMGFYNILNVKSFTFYDFDIAESTKAYFNSIVGADLKIKLVNWKLPNKVAKSSWERGQLSSIQDCILRNGEYAFVLLVDLDEYLVPRQHFTLSELVEELTKHSKRKIGSYIFRHSYFCQPNSTVISKNDLKLRTSMWTIRESKVWPTKMRSKVIVKTGTVAECGIHFVWKHWKGWKSGSVPWEMAMIHHYSENGCRDIKHHPMVEDRTAESFKIEILFSKPMVKFRELNHV